MADVIDAVPDPAPLPGLESPPMDATALELAVRRTIAAHQRAGLLSELDAGTCELAIQLARVVAIGVQSRRSTGASMAARELRETLAMLPQPEEGSGDVDAWDALAQQLHKLEQEAQADASDH